MMLGREMCFKTRETGKNNNVPFLAGLPSTLPATFSPAPVTLSLALAAGAFFAFVVVVVLLVGVFLVTRPVATLALGLDVFALVAFLVEVRFFPSGSVDGTDRMRGFVMPAAYLVSLLCAVWRVHTYRSLESFL
jgi:hypothetical protein